MKIEEKRKNMSYSSKKSSLYPLGTLFICSKEIFKR